jgi:pyruvate ferredoxin oxidoreductase beta subunit
MHTQLGSAGSAATGTAAGLKALMRKGKLKDERINVIAFCGDGGGADMGLGAISAALTHTDYSFLVILYDNESYANTDIQLSGQTPWGAVTTFSPAGKSKRIMHKRWKKNVPGMMAAGHPESKYIASACASYGIDFMNKTRKALELGGPTFLHTLDPCPKGWHYDPQISHELGKLAVETGIWPLFECENNVLRLTGTTKSIAEGRFKRKPVREYLSKQGRFAHFTEEDYDYFQRKIDEQWATQLIPGVTSYSVEDPRILNT